MVLDEDVEQRSQRSQEEHFKGEEIKEAKIISNLKRNSQNMIPNFNNMNYRFNEDSSISLGLQSFMEIEHSPRHKQQSTS